MQRKQKKINKTAALELNERNKDRLTVELKPTSEFREIAILWSFEAQP
jgi:hypothetical protein